VFYQLIEEQTKTLMLAEASDEYVLKTISEAKVPVEQEKPNRLLIIILVTLMAFGLSAILSVFLSINR